MPLRPATLLSALAIVVTISSAAAALHTWLQRPAALALGENGEDGTSAFAPSERQAPQIARETAAGRPPHSLLIDQVRTQADRLVDQPPLPKSPALEAPTPQNAKRVLPGVPSPASTAAADRPRTYRASYVETPALALPSPGLSGTSRTIQSAQSATPTALSPAVASVVAGAAAGSTVVAVDPSAPGNRLTAKGQQVSVQALVTDPETGDDEIVVNVNPVGTTTDQTPSQQRSRNALLGGLTLEEELFRTRWGWAAFDQARRAALNAAADHRTSEVGF